MSGVLLLFYSDCDTYTYNVVLVVAVLLYAFILSMPFHFVAFLFTSHFIHRILSSFADSWCFSLFLSLSLDVFVCGVSWVFSTGKWLNDFSILFFGQQNFSFLCYSFALSQHPVFCFPFVMLESHLVCIWLLWQLRDFHNMRVNSLAVIKCIYTHFILSPSRILL